MLCKRQLSDRREVQGHACILARRSMISWIVRPALVKAPQVRFVTRWSSGRGLNSATRSRQPELRHVDYVSCGSPVLGMEIMGRLSRFPADRHDARQEFNHGITENVVAVSGHHMA